MSKTDPRKAPQVLLILVGAFIALPILEAVTVLPGLLTRPNSSLFIPFSVVSLASAVAGCVFASLKLNPTQIDSSKAELPPSDKYQVDMLISLAMLELCAILGIFLVTHPILSYVLVGITILGMLLFVLAPTIQYCRVLKESMSNQ